MALDDNTLDPSSRSRRGDKGRQLSSRFGTALKMVKWGAALTFILGVLIALGIFIWTFCRIEPGNDQIAILIRKTGVNLKPDEIIATKPGQKGIQLVTLTTGRYFYNPLIWDWQYAPATIIPEGKFGVVTRLYGKDLPSGEIIASEGYKGIAEEILRPAKYFINPYAERVELFDAITIGDKEKKKEFVVGVVTHLVGRDPLHSELSDEEKNMYVVPEGVKGVQKKTLGIGTHYLNPYVYSVTEVSLETQTLDLQGDDVITFLTEDGFQVRVEGTLIFSIDEEWASQLIQQVGDMDDIAKKLILPKVRGFSRTEGSKHPAINFISGKTRQQFQESLENHLRTQCSRWGIQIRSMLVRNITPPDEVSAIIREREVALQNQRKIEQQIEQARSQAELTRQEMLAEQNREKVESETTAIRARIQAEQEQSVLLTAGQRKLDVARIEAEAAQLQADAVIIKAEADRDVVAMHNTAEAVVAGAMSEAFGGGRNLARYTLYRKTAPMIEAIVSTDRVPGLGGIFESFLPDQRPASAQQRPAMGGSE